MKHILLFISVLALIFSCKSSDNGDNPTPTPSNFSRQAMLTDLADDVIIPAYSALNVANNNLKSSVNAFTSNPNATTLSEARLALENAYTVYQTASFYEVGPAKNENLRLFSNTYPVNTELTQQLALQSDFMLHLGSNASKQGYPALDYLLFGFANSDAEILNKFTTDANANQYKLFINALANRLHEKSNTVLTAWQEAYRDSFIANDGSSTSASVDLIANDFLLYYEKFYRNGKVRFPIGYDSGQASPQNVESYYNPQLSKTLLVSATNAMKNFFQGKKYDGSGTGKGFKQYLIAMDRQDIATTIETKFDNILTANNAISSDYVDAVQNDRISFLNLHDRIQENVISMKVEMMQAMNISVAYFDGDGD